MTQQAPSSPPPQFLLHRRGGACLIPGQRPQPLTAEQIDETRAQLRPLATTVDAAHHERLSHADAAYRHAVGRWRSSDPSEEHVARRLAACRRAYVADEAAWPTLPVSAVRRVELMLTAAEEDGTAVAPPAHVWMCRDPDGQSVLLARRGAAVSVSGLHPVEQDFVRAQAHDLGCAERITVLAPGQLPASPVDAVFAYGGCLSESAALLRQIGAAMRPSATLWLCVPAPLCGPLHGLATALGWQRQTVFHGVDVPVLPGGWPVDHAGQLWRLSAATPSGSEGHAAVVGRSAEVAAAPHRWIEVSSLSPNALQPGLTATVLDVFAACSPWSELDRAVRPAREHEVGLWASEAGHAVTVLVHRRRGYALATVQPHSGALEYALLTAIFDRAGDLYTRVRPQPERLQTWQELSIAR